MLLSVPLPVCCQPAPARRSAGSIALLSGVLEATLQESCTPQTLHRTRHSSGWQLVLGAGAVPAQPPASEAWLPNHSRCFACLPYQVIPKTKATASITVRNFPKLILLPFCEIAKSWSCTWKKDCWPNWSVICIFYGYLHVCAAVDQKQIH